MQVFKLFFKLLRTNYKIILVYFGVFLAMVTILVNLQYSKVQTGYSQDKLDIAVVDEDNSAYSAAFMDFFKDKHNLVEVENDEKEIAEGLYWREFAYVVVIPKGFYDSLFTEKPMELNKMEVPGSFSAGYFEADFDMFNQKIITLLECGMTFDDAIQEIMDLKELAPQVHMASFVNEAQGDTTTGVFNHMPYFFVAVGIAAISLVLHALNDREVKDRTECSPESLINRNIGLIAGVLVMGLAMQIVAVLLAAAFTGGKALTDPRLPFFILNSVCVMVFSLSLGYFAGMITKSDAAMNGLINIFSLTLCFLGGVFVPPSVMGDSVKNVCRFVPTYWYTTSNDMIGKMATADSEFLAVFAKNCLGMVLAGIAVFVLTLVLVNAKRKRA